MTEPCEMTALEAGAAIAAGRLTSEALVGSCLARIEAREPDVRAWSFLDPDLALTEARRRDAEPRRGPLHGVPAGIQDVIDTADMPTAYGSPIYEGHSPFADASCVAMLRAARSAASTVGKGCVRNYRSPGRTVHSKK